MVYPSVIQSGLCQSKGVASIELRIINKNIRETNFHYQ
jgi:hypothetical protein